MTKGPICRDIERLILDREEAALGAGDERLVRGHLRVCVRCRDFESVRARMRQGLSATSWPALPDDLDRRARRLAGRSLAQDRPDAGGARGPLPWPVLAALAVIVVLTAGWSSVILADVDLGQALADLPPEAKTALLLIAQNALMLFFAPLVLRAGRPSGQGFPGNG
ncbi:MAG: hypothetical protein R6X21_10690, partial [Candidatus Aminicenantes bacterium]